MKTFDHLIKFSGIKLGTTMSYKTNTDNIYPEGSFITANENPTLQLKIIKYYQRIYYCAVVGDEEKKQLAYFQRELRAPVTAEKKEVSN